MKVYVYPADVQGCGYVRLIWSANHLRRAGHDVTVIPPTAKTGIGGRIDSRLYDEKNKRRGRLVDVNVPEDADVVVLQRVLMRHLAVDAIPMIRARGVAVVVDMDDDLTRLDPENGAFNAMHPLNVRDRDRNWNHATTACLNATLVTVSTPALLATYAPHGRGRVIYNSVPAGFLSISHDDSDVVGWAGALFSHPKDMLPLGPSIARLVRDHGVDFAVVGPGDGVVEALGLPHAPLATGPVNIQQWPFAIAENIGIGIVPLADTQFNAAKSFLKGLEYSALGIPWVASPVVEYKRLQRELGVGALARKPLDWFRSLKRLVDDEDHRLEQSAAGREAVRRLATIEGNAWRLWEAWADALKAERQAYRGNASSVSGAALFMRRPQ